MFCTGVRDVFIRIRVLMCRKCSRLLMCRKCSSLLTLSNEHSCEFKYYLGNPITAISRSLLLISRSLPARYDLGNPITAMFIIASTDDYPTMPAQVRERESERASERASEREREREAEREMERGKERSFY